MKKKILQKIKKKFLKFKKNVKKSLKIPILKIQKINYIKIKKNWKAFKFKKNWKPKIGKKEIKNWNKNPKNQNNISIKNIFKILKKKLKKSLSFSVAPPVQAAAVLLVWRHQQPHGRGGPSLCPDQGHQITTAPPGGSPWGNPRRLFARQLWAAPRGLHPGRRAVRPVHGEAAQKARASAVLDQAQAGLGNPSAEEEVSGLGIFFWIFFNNLDFNLFIFFLN